MVCCYWKGKAFIVWVIVGKSLDLACQKNWSECRMEFYIVAFLFPLNGHCCIERGVSLGLCGSSVWLVYIQNLLLWAMPIQSLELLILCQIWDLGPRLATNSELFELNWSCLNDCASWLRVGLCMTSLMPLTRSDLKLILMYSGFRI